MSSDFSPQLRQRLLGTTVVFDLDGTLVDTAPDLIGATHHVLAMHGIDPIAGERIRPWISFGARRMIVEAFSMAGHGLDEAETNRLQEKFLDYYVSNIARDSRPFPAVETSLQLLAEAGARLAICTNKRAHLSDMLLEALNIRSYFAAIAGRDTFPVCKPDPAHLIGSIRMAGGDPRRAIMIGDSVSDVKAARSAGTPVIGVTFGYTDIPMADLGPDALIDGYSELPGALEALL